MLKYSKCYPSAFKKKRVLCERSINGFKSMSFHSSVEENVPIFHTIRRNNALDCLIPCSSSDQFDVDLTSPAGVNETAMEAREDDVLPDSLLNALASAASCTAAAIERGNSRTQVEILMPEFWDPISGPIFPNRGDQERFWRMTRRFVEELAKATQSSALRVIYPDAGVAAMLAHQWPDANFSVASLGDRRPIKQEDELIVIACPDPPGADDCMRAVRQASEMDEKSGVPERPVVLFNQRLSSGDVGLGLNARRLRNTFLSNFVITYSLRPIGEIGTVFRAYPGLWKVFLEEESMAGRYRLIKESPSRPQGEALEFLIREAMQPESGVADESPKQIGFFEQLGSALSSLQRFSRNLSK